MTFKFEFIVDRLGNLDARVEDLLTPIVMLKTNVSKKIMLILSLFFITLLSH